MTDEQPTNPEILTRVDPSLVFDAITTAATVAGLGIAVSDHIGKSEPPPPPSPPGDADSKSD